MNECNIGTWFKCFQVFISCYDEGVCPLVRCGNSSALYIVCCWYTSHYVAWLNWHSFENIELLTYLADTSALQSTVLELQSCNLQLSLFPLPMQDLSTATASSPQQILLLALISVGVVITVVVVTTIVICSAQ